jgi:hypothetical protein
MQTLTGSVILEEEQGQSPFDRAHGNALAFMVNMQTCATFETLAQRIELLEIVMSLPVMSSSAAQLIKMTRLGYEQELNEIDMAIKVYCSLPGVPEA